MHVINSLTIIYIVTCHCQLSLTICSSPLSVLSSYYSIHSAVFYLNSLVFLVLKKRDAIILLVKYHNIKYLKKTHKYGLPLPKSVDDALAIDRHSGSTLWVDAIAKELKNVRVAFDNLKDGRNAPHGFQFVKCHMIFDIKMEDFRRKAHLVVGRHI